MNILIGPSTHICFTPYNTPKEQRKMVVLVEHSELQALEAENYALQDQVKGLQELMAQPDEKYNDTLLPFLALMRRELHANSHKGDREGWLGMTAATALGEIEHHTEKLAHAFNRGRWELVNEHAADVANCCMMLLDVCGMLGAPCRVFGMSLVVDGNMPDGEIHLAGAEDGTVILRVNDGKAGGV